ncbi:N-acetylglucosamine-6-phosphate deacetylase [Bacillus lacus]|uniref:N-acetylglucosamine-6-phosphate deacetylase n=1 Tax=Metabacillus lacus TaxID=1983721 RepID=A0A7X2IYE6_9BACI|nr:N-acetylglucosamine-6-phosphate deacetylase [Metabacillus lacus]MRX71904.1 N-acetylglucosamine-6-phosphate deacetylase [Metabacillus lacus]
MGLNEQKTAILHTEIYCENEIIENGYVIIRDGVIEEAGDMSHAPSFNNCTLIQLDERSTAVPGFIDIHIHGAAGADTMDATRDALQKMAAALPAEGTTSFLATTMTQDSAAIDAALISCAQYIGTQTKKGAEMVGIHLEGPFVNPKKAGAQPAEHILPPNPLLFDHWQTLSGSTIKIVTMAPEMEGGMNFTKKLTSEGVIPSIGHSSASYSEAKEAVMNGAKQVTHLFNQMSPLHHREPGTAGAALLEDSLSAEVIADGVHISPEMVRLALKVKGQNGLILITDAIRAKFMPPGTYDLGGQQVTVGEGRAVLPDGTLAGSILTMDTAVRNMMLFTGCSLRDAVRMASENPARQLGLFHRKGSIKEGKDADLVFLDASHEVIMTVTRGMISYRRGEQIEHNRS